MFLEKLLTHCNHFTDWHLVLVVVFYRVKYNDFLHFWTVCNDAADLAQLLLTYHYKARVGVLDTKQQIGALGQFDAQWHIYSTCV